MGSARLPGGRKGPDELPRIVSMAEINNRAASRACIALVSPRCELQAAAAAAIEKCRPKGLELGRRGEQHLLMFKEGLVEVERFSDAAMGHEVRAGHHEPGYKNSRAKTREKEEPLMRVWRRARRSEARRGTTDVTVDGGALHSAADEEACEGPEGGAMARTRVGGRPWKRLQKRPKSQVWWSTKVSSDMSSVLAASACTA